MSNERGYNGGMPSRKSQTVAEDTLVFELRDDEAARSAWDEYRNGTGAHTGVSAVCEYVMGGRPGAASLTALYRERALYAWEGRDWQIAVPAPPPLNAEVNLSAVHHLRLNDPADSGWLLKELIRDRRVRCAYRPAIYKVLDAPFSVTGAELVTNGDFKDRHARSASMAGTAEFEVMAAMAQLMKLASRRDRQWALEDCGFPAVWAELDDLPRKGGIAVIDDGPYTGHSELEGRIQEINVLPAGLPPSTSDHATAVAAVISAIREPPHGISGCCTAPIELYNVFTPEGMSPEALCTALKKVRVSDAKVVNLSIGSRVQDPVVKQQIEECIQAGLVLVAAVGNIDEFGSDPVYPAAYDGVIGVGGTTQSKIRADWSATGVHVDISAPGLLIYSAYAQNDISFWHGTSFAAPMVSAAVWLAMGAPPNWVRADIIKLLENSSSGRGRRNDDLGFGLLDMARIADHMRAGSTDLDIP